jgi:hypothetical protein
MTRYQRQFARQRRILRKIATNPCHPSTINATRIAAIDGAAIIVLPLPVYQGYQPIISVKIIKNMIWCFLINDFMIILS